MEFTSFGLKNDRSRKILQIASFAIALGVIMFCILLYGRQIGFDQGYMVENAEMQALEKVLAIDGGAKLYKALANFYLYIGIFLVFLMGGRLIKNEIISQIICLLALLLIFYNFGQIYLAKSDRLDDLDHSIIC